MDAIDEPEELILAGDEVIRGIFNCTGVKVGEIALVLTTDIFMHDKRWLEVANLQTGEICMGMQKFFKLYKKGSNLRRKEEDYYGQD